MTPNKRILLGMIVCALMLGGVGYVLASTSTGSVNVTPEIPRFSDVVFPSAVDPESPASLSFTLEYGQGITGGDEIWVHWYADSITPDLSCSGAPSSIDQESHYYALWFNSWSVGWSDSGPSGRVNNYVQPDPTTLPIIDGSDIGLGCDVTFDGLAKSEIWHLYMKLKYTDPLGNPGTVVYEVTFDMNGYISVSVQASFDFGDVEQGQVLIGITDPVSGYLNVTIESNIDYYVQLSGTDPTKDADSFSVSNIVQNSIDDSGSAIALTGVLANLEGLGLQSAGVATHHAYLWISIPASAPVGLYTFTLTIVGVAA